MIGEEASSDNPISEGTFCFNITLDSDIYKEGLEIFTLRLQSDDECVYLGRDVALARVQANGGIIIGGSCAHAVTTFSCMYNYSGESEHCIFLSPSSK